MTAMTIAIAFWFSPALADTLQFTVPMNATRMIHHAGALNLDCSSMGDTVIRVTTPPQHGTAWVSRGVGHSTYPTSNPRNVCNVRRTPQTQLSYKPAKNYVGDDLISLEMIFPDGTSKDDTVNISVK